MKSDSLAERGESILNLINGREKNIHDSEISMESLVTEDVHLQQMIESFIFL